MTDFQEFTFLSSDGHTQLHGAQWTPADREPIAVLQIAHGVAEHILRYDDFARYLNDRGILVAGHDHLGHGKSLPEGGTPVYFGDRATWETVVDDIHLLHDRLREQYPDLPILLMGHSMGSFLSRTYLIRYPGTVDAAIIMGTGWQPEMTIRGGLLLAGILSGLKGPDAVSKMVTNMAFGAYNKAFGDKPRTPNDWLSADTDNVDRYMADPPVRRGRHGGPVPPDAAGPAVQSDPREHRPDGQKRPHPADRRAGRPGGRYGGRCPADPRRLQAGGDQGRDPEAVSRPAA